MINKKMCSILFSLVVLGFLNTSIAQSSPGRSPSVEPVVEIDIEDAKNENAKANGYNFEGPEKKRVPANIVTNTQAPSSYLGPIIFLITLPFALWLMVNKKFSSKSHEKNIDYYPKTHQFKPFKSEFQETDDDDDDVDFPKAS